MRTTLLAVIAIITMPLFSRAQSTLSFPRVIPPAEFRATGFAIVNPGSTNATVIFTLFGEDGAVQQTSTQTIVARGQLAKFASEFFPGAKNAGWVQAASETPGLQGFWLGGDMTTFADGAEAAPSSSEIVVPLTTGNSEIDIANTGAADVTVLIDLLGQEGFDLAMTIPSPQKIPAKGFFKSDIAALFGSADLSQTAHLRIKCGCPNPSPFAAVLIARDFIAGPSWVVVNAVPASTPATVMNFSQLIDGPVGAKRCGNRRPQAGKGCQHDGNPDGAGEFLTRATGTISELAVRPTGLPAKLRPLPQGGERLLVVADGVVIGVGCTGPITGNTQEARAFRLLLAQAEMVAEGD